MRFVGLLRVGFICGLPDSETCSAACFVFDPNLACWWEKYFDSKFAAILFFCNSWQPVQGCFHMMMRAWELCIQIRAVTQEILPNIITNNLLYCNIAVRGQGSYFVRIRFSVNGELLVSCSWLFADNRYESRSWVSASTFDHDVITPNLSFLPQTSCWRSNLIFLLL